MMNREIKFRVWCSNDINPNGKMYYPTDGVEIGVGNRKNEGAFVISQHGDLLLPDADTLHMTHGFTWARVSVNGQELMQYTGLKDKNGKEIYESDLVKYNNEHIGEVKYIEQYTAFKAVFADDLWTELYENIEVIGNIYENR